MGAMHLHGRYGNADIVGNLLVQATGRNLEHDLTLAGTKRLKTLSQHSQSIILLPTGAVASETGLDSFEEVLIAKRLGEKLDGTAFHRLHTHPHVGVRCHEDDREWAVRRYQLALKLKTTPSRQSDVENQAGGPIGRISFEKIGNRGK